MSKLVSNLKVVENQPLSNNYFLLKLASDQNLPAMQPGQFAELKIDYSPTTFLRRPLSIYDFDSQKNEIHFLVQIVGDGTAALSKLKKNDEVNVIFPLGRGFSYPTSNNHILLIGGGVGIAPMLLWGKILASKGYKPEFLLGFRNAAAVIEIDKFKQYGQVHITTEDGSVGEKGYVTQHSILMDDKKFGYIYTCGPDAMMKSVAKYAYKKEIFCEVSLENHMACGFGVCLCCVTDSTRGNVCVCTEGPVFNILELKWQN